MIRQLFAVLLTIGWAGIYSTVLLLGAPALIGCPLSQVLQTTNSGMGAGVSSAVAELGRVCVGEQLPARRHPVEMYSAAQSWPLS
jgi:hypothetical protein